MPLRLLLKEDRDPEMCRLINTYGVLSADVLAAVLGFGSSPQDVQTVARLIARLAKEGLVQYCVQRHMHYGVSFAELLSRAVYGGLTRRLVPPGDHP